VVKQYSNSWRLFFLIASATALIAGWLSTRVAYADEYPLYSNIHAEDNKVHIKSDILIASSTENLAEFKGHVRATQGSTVITCEQLKLFFKKGTLTEGKSNPGDNSIERIIATDNVKIRMENRVAFAEHAEYTLSNEKIILTGNPAKVSSGNTFITGNKITMWLDGRIQVEGKKGDQVESIIYPDKGLPTQ
jgi:lipopolysaccharide export system protein LptA